MLWGGRWEGGSCLGTHVRIKDFKIKKIKKKKKKQKTKNIYINQVRDMGKKTKRKQMTVWNLASVSPFGEEKRKQNKKQNTNRMRWGITID